MRRKIPRDTLIAFPHSQPDSILIPRRFQYHSSPISFRHSISISRTQFRQPSQNVRARRPKRVGQKCSLRNRTFKRNELPQNAIRCCQSHADRWGESRWAGLLVSTLNGGGAPPPNPAVDVRVSCRLASRSECRTSSQVPFCPIGASSNLHNTINPTDSDYWCVSIR